MTITLEWWWAIPFLIACGGAFIAALANEWGPFYVGLLLAECVLIGHYL